MSQSFNRVEFEKVKKLQKLKKPKSRQEIMNITGFGKETVRKAMKAPNWPQYRKNEISRLKAAKLKRDELLRNKPFEIEDNFLLQNNEGEFSEGFSTRADRTLSKKRKQYIIAISIAVVLLLVIKVAFL